jgi:hypothetical protein
MNMIRPVSREKWEELHAIAKAAFEDWLEWGHLSPSAVSKFLQCQEKWDRHYNHSKLFTPNVDMIRGSLTHMYVEFFLKAVIKAIGDKGLNYLVDTAKCLEITKKHPAVILPAEVQEQEARYEAEYLSLYEEDTTSKLGFQLVKKAAQELFFLWHKELISKSYIPLSSEEKCFGYINTEVGVVPLTGYIDMSIYDAETSKTYIMDLKVGQKKRDPEKSIQLAMYGLMKNVKNVGFWQLKPAKVRTPHKSEIITATLEDRYCEHISSMVELVAVGIQAKNYIKTDPENWACSEKWCNHFEECRG